MAVGVARPLLLVHGQSGTPEEPHMLAESEAPAAKRMLWKRLPKSRFARCCDAMDQEMELSLELADGPRVMVTEEYIDRYIPLEHIRCHDAEVQHERAVAATAAQDRATSSIALALFAPALAERRTQQRAGRRVVSPPEKHIGGPYTVAEDLPPDQVRASVLGRQRAPWRPPPSPEELSAPLPVPQDDTSPPKPQPAALEQALQKPHEPLRQQQQGGPRAEPGLVFRGGPGSQLAAACGAGPGGVIQPSSQAARQPAAWSQQQPARAGVGERLTPAARVVKR